MPLLIKLSSTLRSQVPGYDPMTGMAMDYRPGESVAGLLQRLGIDPGQVKVIMVNGRAATLESELSDGDRVGLFPAVGGG